MRFGKEASLAHQLVVCLRSIDSKTMVYFLANNVFEMQFEVSVSSAQVTPDIVLNGINFLVEH